MRNKSSFGSASLNLTYQPFTDTLKVPVAIAPPKQVTLFLYKPYADINWKQSLLKEGLEVKTGQRLAVSDDDDAYIVSSVTGAVKSIAAFTSDYGRELTAVTIEQAAKESIDDSFKAAAENMALETALKYLCNLPGNPPWHLFAGDEKKIKAIVINGMDRDLLVNANQFVVANQVSDLTVGIKAIKQITGVETVYLALGRDRMQGLGHVGATLIPVDDVYPGALPRLIMKDSLNQIVPAGREPEDLGVAFFSAQAVVAIGESFATGILSITNTVTFINKDGSGSVVRVPMGTPVGDIIRHHDVTLEDRDRIVLGGPMTGQAIYSVAHPVQRDTDAVMIQARQQIPHVSDYPCINCGECVRACPALIQVNMLVRFLEAGQYQDAADGYDLLSCFDCGLCSYVCPARIPIFQHIRLGKYELKRAQEAEAETAQEVEETDA